ncbi:hypothetical protein BJ912DRAFT_1058795 [Pholiota molesta]|nr:hypothetical protein BJ912DRAFT_1058795 [Pholiota molesta]
MPIAMTDANTHYAELPTPATAAAMSCSRLRMPTAPTSSRDARHTTTDPTPTAFLPQRRCSRLWTPTAPTSSRDARHNDPDAHPHRLLAAAPLLATTDAHCPHVVPRCPDTTTTDAHPHRLLVVLRRTDTATMDAYPPSSCHDSRTDARATEPHVLLQLLLLAVAPPRPHRTPATPPPPPRRPAMRVYHVDGHPPPATSPRDTWTPRTAAIAQCSYRSPLSKEGCGPAFDDVVPSPHIPPPRALTYHIIRAAFHHPVHAHPQPSAFTTRLQCLQPLRCADA